MTIRSFLLAGVVAASALLAGCAGGYVGAYAPGPPPAPYAVGAIGVAPGPGYVWADGYWDRRGGDWAWVRGSWRRPPHPHAHWVAPRWERRGNDWHRREGHWR